MSIDHSLSFHLVRTLVLMDSLRKKIKRGASSSTLKRSSSARSCSASTGASLMELLRPGCLRSEKGVRRRPSTPEKKKTNVSSSRCTTSTLKDNKISGESSFTSLGEWLLSSPGSKPDSMNGGELYVLRSHYSSRRVHPSSSSSKRPQTNADHATSLVSKARDSFSMNKTVKNEGENNPDASLDKLTSSLRRKLSGSKSMKRVSFRLPEEADIVTFYPSSEEMVIDCEENFV